MSAQALGEWRRFVSGWAQELFDGTLAQWAEGLALPQSERNKSGFAPEDAPWLVDPLNAQEDPFVRGTVCRWAVGAAKSLLGEIVIAKDVREASGILYYVHQTDEAAREAMDDRVKPCLEANGEMGIEMPKLRSDKRTIRMRFRGLVLYAVGAKPSAANSKRVRRGIFEETHLWDKGILSAMMDRLIAVSGAKFLILSSGSVAEDETDTEFRNGTAEEWHVCCPYCRTPQMMKNRSLLFDVNDSTMTRDGEHNWGEIRKAVYYQCSNEGCPGNGKPGEARKWRDSETLRRKLTASGYYVQTNPNASGEVRSFHINNLAVHWNSWYSLLYRWIAANTARKQGNIELFKEYIQKQLAEAWDESRGFVETGKIPANRLGNYPLGVMPGKWEDGWPELTRFCTIDKNEGWFTLIVRAFSADGRNRLVAAHGGTRPGTGAAKVSPAVLTFDECEELRKRYGVEENRTFIDVADDTKLCQQKCVEYGWQGFWGHIAKSWPHSISSSYHPRMLAAWRGQKYKHLPEDPVRYPFSTEQRANANSGLGKREQIAVYWYWSNPTIKDFWHYCLAGGGVGFTHFREVSTVYTQQINAEIKIFKGGNKVWDHGKRDNHFGDCEQMVFVAAIMDTDIDMGESIVRDMMLKAGAVE